MSRKLDNGWPLQSGTGVDIDCGGALELETTGMFDPSNLARRGAT
jgi:hypothetical protein